MLPAFQTPATSPTAVIRSKPALRRCAALLVALSLALPAPAFALDKKEQGILAGALGILLFQELAKSANAKAQPRHVQPAPIPHQPAPVRYAPSVYRTPAAYAFASYSSAERRAIQRSLARMGYYYGSVDGAFGPSTYNATLSYARAQGSESALHDQSAAYGVYDQLLYERR
jgi:hypothetical protein